MKTKRSLLILLLILSLACNTITQVFVPTPTATPVPPTFTPSATPTPTATPFPAPAYIPLECQGQAVATVPAATTIAQPTPSLGGNPPLTTEEQLKVFDQVVATINKVYLYPDFNGVDWPAIVKTYRAKVAGGLETEAFYDEMINLMAELKDDHSQFLSPVMVSAEEAALAGHNDYVGIGIYADSLVKKGRVTILTVFPGSAADHAGLKPHDSLITLDGLPLIENGVSHSERLRGPECTALRVTVQTPGENPRDVVMVRFKVTGPLPIESHLVRTSDGSRVGYIFIPTFFDETIPDQVKQALEDFGPLDGLILDNRMNPGGSSSVLDPILSYFASGKMGQFVSRTERRPFQIEGNAINNSQTVPLIVLVGEGTVSFGEIFSGILQDIGRAKLVGQTTLGNVETLHGYSFDDGSHIWIAQERFDPINSHADWEKDGIIPNVEAFADWDTFTFDTDPAIAAALTLLGHK